MQFPTTNVWRHIEAKIKNLSLSELRFPLSHDCHVQSRKTHTNMNLRHENKSSGAKRHPQYVLCGLEYSECKSSNSEFQFSVDSKSLKTPHLHSDVSARNFLFGINHSLHKAINEHYSKTERKFSKFSMRESTNYASENFITNSILRGILKGCAEQNALGSLAAAGIPYSHIRAMYIVVLNNRIPQQDYSCTCQSGFSSFLGDLYSSFIGNSSVSNKLFLWNQKKWGMKHADVVLETMAIYVPCQPCLRYLKIVSKYVEMRKYNLGRQNTHCMKRFQSSNSTFTASSLQRRVRRVFPRLPRTRWKQKNELFSEFSLHDFYGRDASLTPSLPVFVTRDPELRVVHRVTWERRVVPRTGIEVN